MTIKRLGPLSTGGGYPVIAAGVRLVNPNDRKALADATLKLSTDPEAEANGRRVVELIREACLEGDLERVSVLHALFSSVASRVPEFHVYLASVVARGDTAEIEKLLNFPRSGRGRRPGDIFEFVALIEFVMGAQELDHATDAVTWLVKHRREIDLPEQYLPTAKTLLNQHARLGEFFRLWSSSIYVKPELLTLMPPSLPGSEYTAEMVEQARFPPADGSAWPNGFLIEVRPPLEKAKGKKSSK